MASEKTPDQTPATVSILSKYSNRVILKSIFGRGDGGVGLIGQRVVIGGWVKSAKEVKKDPVKVQQMVDHSAAATTSVDESSPADVTCAEVLQAKIPIFRRIIKVLGGLSSVQKDKLDSDITKPQQQMTPPSIMILQVSDGSFVGNIQILVDSSIARPDHVMFTGSCILAEGVLQQPSLQGGKHIIELKADTVLHVGTVDLTRYPLSKKRLPLESLRDSNLHFRPRTTTVASVLRVRNAMNLASHSFFQENGFLYVQLPIITNMDAEGFSEKFQVTTLLSQEKIEEAVVLDDDRGFSLETVRASIEEKRKKVEQLGRTDSNKETLVAAKQDLKKTTELGSRLEAKEKSKPANAVRDLKINYSKDFFSCQTYLTVSGRLHLESYACALGNVYSFGPIFKAETSESKKTLAEMWIVEAEMAFSQLKDAMNCAEDFLKFLCKSVLESCSEDLSFLSRRVDKAIVDRLHSVTSIPFEKITYDKAVDLLKKVTERRFANKIDSGLPLSEEHESYLVDEMYKRPVIVYNPPRELKAFYVRQNEDQRTVAAFDVIVPKIGTIIRGSQNEERYDMLSARIKELGLQKEQYQWYLDLRRNGTVKHSGFSLVFDLLVLYATGLNDVRDAVPFPRSRSLKIN